LDPGGTAELTTADVVRVDRELGDSERFIPLLPEVGYAEV